MAKLNFRSMFKNWFSTDSRDDYTRENSVIMGFPREVVTSVDTPIEAMQLPAVYRCVDILSGTIASLPMELKHDSGGGLYEPCPCDDLQYILSGVANDRQTFYELMYNAISRRYLLGNSFILPIWSGSKIKELLLVDGVSYDVYNNVYIVNDPILGISDTYAPSEIIHIRNRSFDGYVGMSTISYAFRTMTLSKIADMQTMRGLRDGNRLKGFLTGGNPSVGLGSISDDMTDKVAKRIEGDVEQDKLVIRIPGALDFKPYTMSPQDVELLSTRKYGVYDICRFFGVHPDMVFVEHSAGNYKASENVQVTFLQQTLKPILRQIESEFSAKLLAPSIQKRYKIEYNTETMYFTTAGSKSEYYKQCIESGSMTPNEVRKKEGRKPLEGGDTAFISCNVAPLERIIAENNANADEEKKK